MEVFLFAVLSQRRELAERISEELAMVRALLLLPLGHLTFNRMSSPPVKIHICNLQWNISEVAKYILYDIT